MLERAIKRLKTASERLIGQTKVCRICFKNNNEYSLLKIFNDIDLCHKCSQTLSPIFENFKIEGTKALSIFCYDEVFKELIYQFKGCYDIELKNIFLGKYLKELKILYKGFVIIPAPSSKEDDENRGFNHVEEIFKTLKLPLEKCVSKDGKFKQADHNFNERKQIKEYLKISDVSLRGKRCLLVDDIYTTGATMKCMINLVKSKGVKDVKVLVLCKTHLKDNI